MNADELLDYLFGGKNLGEIAFHAWAVKEPYGVVERFGFAG